MTARLRLILPTIETLAIAAFGFLVIQGCRVYAEWKLGVQLVPGDLILRIGDHYLRALGITYGVFRVVGFHPFYRPGYRVWLERTPWTSRKPLPIGPVSLVWEDGVALFVLVLLTPTVPGCDPARLVGLTLFSYLVALAATLAPTGEPAYAYLIAFGLGLMIRLYPQSEVMLAIGMVVYTTGYVGLRRSLGRFPWPVGLQEAFTASAPLERFVQPKPTDPCGWPYDRLCPTTDPRVRLGLLDALLLSMLAGWWLFAVESLFPDPREAIGLFAGLLSTGTMIVALGRLGVYTRGYAPPINLWGRLWTFRWIVRGYDQVFIGPLCTLAVGPLSIVLFHWLGWRALLYLPITCSLVLFTALAMPPRLRRWRLTGRHRIVPALSSQKELIKIG